LRFLNLASHQKYFGCFLATNNVVVLVDLKIMIMNFIGKIINLVAITTPSNPKSILKQQQTLVTKSLVVEPTLNIGGGLVLSILP
jgi:hypothetical protein